MSKYLPNETHPWLKQARQNVRKIRPRIMVRHCTNECLPEDLNMGMEGGCIRIDYK